MFMAFRELAEQFDQILLLAAAFEYRSKGCAVYSGYSNLSQPW